MSSRSVKKSEALVKAYAKRFGFGHYNIHVSPLPKEDAAPDGGYWGRSHWNHHEEYFNVQVVPDSVLTDAEREHLVLHELTHGLLSYASDNDSNCETVCDRVAKLVAGPGVTGPNYKLFGGDACPWDQFEESAVSMTRRELLGDERKEAVVDQLLDHLGDLTERERFVLGSLFIDRLSFRAVARLMGVSARTVQRIRNSAVRKLSEVV